MKMLIQDEMHYAGKRPAWVTIVADISLVQKVIELVDDAEIERAVVLIHKYETLVEGYNATGESDMLESACNIEHQLRVMLKTAQSKAGSLRPTQASLLSKD